SANGVSADGRDLMAILQLGAKRGAIVALEVDGPDEQLGLPALVTLLTRAPSTERPERRTATGRAWVAGEGERRAGRDLEQALARTRADLADRRADVERDSGDAAEILDAQAALLDEGLARGIRARAE